MRIASPEKIKLFDESAVNPEKTGPKTRGESDYSYLLTSGRPESAKIRQLLEELFSEYPEEHQSELRRRVVTSRTDFQSPFFELFLYGLFQRLGAKIEIHPKVSEETDKRPDFLITLSSGFQFYLEAVLATGETNEERSRKKLVDAIYDLIDRKLESPEYFWTVVIHAQGKNQPSASDIVNSISRYMQGLNRDEVIAGFQEGGFETRYRHEWEKDGWLIEFTPIPKKVEAFSKSQRPIGGEMMSAAVFSHADQDIRDAIKFKIKHHAKVELPYVIAVDAIHWTASGEDFINAIYGSDVVSVTTFADGSYTAKSNRATDGIWIGESAPKNEHVIGIIGTVDLSPWALAGASIRFYPNPYLGGENSLAGLPIDQMVPTDGRLEKKAGQSLADIFGLEPQWPRDKDEKQD